MKLQTFGKSAERSEARVSKECNFIAQPIKHLSSNCIISTLFYFLTIEQFLIQVPSEVRQAPVLKGCIKNCSIVKLYNKVLIIVILYMHDKS